MLKEISTMRLVLIVLVVVFHAFIIYGGGWISPTGFKEISAYGHIAGWSYSFMLESFTFISGYIYLYSCWNKGIRSFKNLLVKKAKRLLIPMLLFGVLYFFFFCDFESVAIFVYDLLSGVGHLWYLAMLFWCFMETWVIQRLKIDGRLALAGIAMLAIFCSWMPMPFQIGKSFYYLFFFYMPVLLVYKRDAIYSFLYRHKTSCLILGWLSFILAYSLIKYMLQYPRPVDNTSLFGKAMCLSLNEFFQLIYSTVGTLVFYVTCFLVAGTTELINRDTRLVELGSYCFGIYIFQQFVLKGLYYKTPVPELVGPYLLPWFAILITLFVSFLLTYLIRLTKAGREIL